MNSFELDTKVLGCPRFSFKKIVEYNVVRPYFKHTKTTSHVIPHYISIVIPINRAGKQLFSASLKIVNKN